MSSGARASIERHSRSFALASRLLPPPVASDAAVVYAWCRRADDAIDEQDAEQDTVQDAEQDAEHGPTLGAQTLAALQHELAELYAGREPSPELAEFAGVVRARGIPWRYPAELLAGMEMDVTGYRYQTCDELLLYCYRVASTVGLMMCHVMGVSDPAALRPAAHLGIAMQLTNICRDVAEDWQRRRLYLPEELLRRHGATELAAQLGSRSLPQAAVPACRGAMIELLALAERYYASSDRGLDYLSPRCALGVNAARRIYSAIGAELARADWDPRAPRAVVPRSRKLGACARALLTVLHRHGPGPLRRHARGLRAAPLSTVQHGTELIPL